MDGDACTVLSCLLPFCLFLSCLFLSRLFLSRLFLSRLFLYRPFDEGPRAGLSSAGRALRFALSIGRFAPTNTDWTFWNAAKGIDLRSLMPRREALRYAE